MKDTNQAHRPPVVASVDEPTLITDRVAAKEVANPAKEFPNGNMATAHAEVGVIQQAWKAGKTQGQDMTLTVTNKEVCTYCRTDLTAMAESSGLKSLTIVEAKTGKVFFWQQGMQKIVEVKRP